MSVEVKVCGLTSRDDALAAAEYGADYLGFVLYPKSPRGITAARLAGIADALAPSLRLVGVFVNESRSLVEQVASDCRLHAVQLHGDESAQAFREMPVPVWRAVRLGDDGIWQPPVEAWAVSRYVVDAAPPVVYGGAGVVADWGRAALLAESRPVMLAGGLTADNVADAVRTVRPLGVDASSGVESMPGKKDLACLKQFIEAARQAA
jgi:phosphoribosylanthranilate isomerase